MKGRTLYIAHRDKIVTQTHRQFQKIWPEATVGLYTGKEKSTDKFNIVASVQSVSENLNDFSQKEFQYLVIDEAHHAAASTYRKVIGFFDAKFILVTSCRPAFLFACRANPYYYAASASIGMDFPLHRSMRVAAIHKPEYR